MKFYLSCSSLVAVVAAWKQTHTETGVRVKFENAEDYNTFIEYTRSKIPKQGKMRQLFDGEPVNSGSGLSTDQKQSLLDVHNSYRSILAEGAFILKQLEHNYGGRDCSIVIVMLRTNLDITF